MPVELSTPSFAYSAPPISRIGGTVAIVSTLLTASARRRGRRSRGTAASCAAGRACPRATRAAPSPRRRCRRRRRGGRRSSTPPRSLLRAHLLERRHEHLELALVLAADVDEDVLGLDRARRDQAALEEPERDAQHDLAVLEGAGLRLVGVDDEVVGPRDLLRLREEAPLAAGREERAAAAAQAGRVQLLDQRVGLIVRALAERGEPADRLVVGELRQRAAVRAGEDHLGDARRRLGHRRSSSTIPGTSSAVTCSR